MKSRPLKNKELTLRPRGWDAIVVAAVLLAALLTGVWIFGKASDKGLVCVISVDGKEYTRVALADAPESGETITVGHGYSVTIEITPDAVWVASATCPNKYCVRTGKISTAGRSIVCLPSRVVVELEASDGQTDFDIVSG